MKTNGSKPDYNEMAEKWGDSHFFTELMDTDWDPETLCFTRDMVCVKPAHTPSSTGERVKTDYSCNARIEAMMYLDPKYYNKYRAYITRNNLHPTYPMYYVNNGKPRREHMFNSWDTLEEDIQGQTAPFLPFHPSDFDYGGNPPTSEEMENFPQGVLIPIIRTEVLVDDILVGVDYRAYANPSDAKEHMKIWEWDENLPFNLYKNHDDAQLYLVPNQPLNWLRDGLTFLNR
ncbi:MAG: hypothetical protein GY751_19930 [Bacteroidetes bacterium]|nr:hypothetical protein [Bacteroidota bacterium]